MLLVLVGSSSQGGVSYQLLQLHIAAPWESRGVAWIVPVITFTVLTGLNTDYDVFLVSGIRKMRVAGLSNDDAIVAGLRSNGAIITTAGAIMALAFSGLLASSTLVVHEVSFVIVLAVLTDTFIVRILLVPAIMALLGDLNWWPTPMDGRDGSPAHRTAPRKALDQLYEEML
mmetsp:Transcript_3323/g.10154  ORF Transcript_3323/g.10154 Transcript_3323/m.10154 type:complete len:172 (-) Transcript_3323:405-920(-)